MRASDADRHATAHRIQDGVGRGLLTFDEGGERLAAAWAARYIDELALLTVDLPSAVPTAPAAVAPGWSTLAALAAAQLRHTLLTRPTGNPRFNRWAAVVIAVALVAAFAVIALAAVHGLFPEHDHVEGVIPGNGLGAGSHGGEVPDGP